MRIRSENSLCRLWDFERPRPQIPIPRHRKVFVVMCCCVYILLLAQALTQPPDTSTDPSTWAPHPTTADFGFDDHAAVRAVAVAYLQTVRNLAPHAV